MRFYVYLIIYYIVVFGFSLVLCLVLPRITPFTFEDSPAQTGQYITLTCSVPEGDLPIRISWVLNNDPVNDYPGVSVASMGKRSSFLTIEAVEAKHAGNFTCLARNLAGSVNYSTELKVNG